MEVGGRRLRRWEEKVRRKGQEKRGREREGEQKESRGKERAKKRKGRKWVNWVLII